MSSDSGKLIFAISFLIRDYRRCKGLSQELLAQRAGLDRTYVSGVERGARNVTLNSLERIICALGVDRKEFFLRLVDEAL